MESTKVRRRTNVFSTARKDPDKRRITALFTESPTSLSENRLNAAPYNRQDAAFANEGKENASGDIFADKTALATTKKPRRRRLNSDQSFDATIDAKTLQAELAQKQEEEIVMRAEIERIEREANERISKANAECVARLHELTSAHNEQLAKLSKVQSDFKELHMQNNGNEKMVNEQKNRLATFEKKCKLADAKVEQHAEKNSRLNETLRQKTATIISRENEINVLKQLLEEHEAESTYLRTKWQSEQTRLTEDLIKCKSELKKLIDSREAYDELLLSESGHHNQRQKIQLHERYRKELYETKEQNAALKERIECLQKENRALQGEQHVKTPSSSKKH